MFESKTVFLTSEGASTSHHFPQSFPVRPPVPSLSVTEHVSSSHTNITQHSPYFKNMTGITTTHKAHAFGDAKGKFSTLLTAPTRTAVCWCQQSSKHPPPQRWVWYLRLLHDMQAQHFIRHGDFSWSANASHFQAHYIESVLKFQNCYIYHQGPRSKKEPLRMK